MDASAVEQQIDISLSKISKWKMHLFITSYPAKILLFLIVSHLIHFSFPVCNYFICKKIMLVIPLVLHIFCTL